MNEIVETDVNAYRRKRIQRLKKIIIGTIITLIVIPTIVSIIFIALYIHSNKELRSLRKEYDELLTTMEQLRDEITFTSDNQDVYSVSPIEDSSRSSEANEDEALPSDEITRHVYLTFDDGPSSNTDNILDILDEYGVKATFFVVGKTDETSVAGYKRIVEEGHTLGMHSYSHRYSQIYSSKEAFAEDLQKLQEYLYEVTGVWSRYYRFPGGSSNTTSKVDMKELIEYLGEQDISYFDWNIVSGDAVSYNLSAESIYQNCITKIEDYDNIIILMHDAQARNTTVEALPRVIEYVLDLDGTEILPITDETVPVQHKKADN